MGYRLLPPPGGPKTSVEVIYEQYLSAFRRRASLEAELAITRKLLAAVVDGACNGLVELDETVLDKEWELRVSPVDVRRGILIVGRTKQ